MRTFCVAVSKLNGGSGGRGSIIGVSPWAQQRQRNRRNHHSAAEVRKHIAVPRIESEVRLVSVASHQRSQRMPRSRQGHAAPRIDGGGDAIVGVPQYPSVIFDGSHARHIEVLPRSAGVAVPAVVGDVDQYLRPVLRKEAYLVGEDRLIADEEAESVAAGLKHLALLSALEIDELVRELLREEEQVAVGDVFTEGHEVNLVVTPSHCAIWIRQQRRVVGPCRIVSEHAGNERSVSAGGDGANQRDRAW